ncbi:hypothetical protein NXW78_06875 [Bacteroides ovatus]|nr:hypothetical protein [Bacteroides ovatus]
MKKYILILFSIISFWSCTEDESIDITVLPSVTTTGDNTFGCLMDGWIYVGGRYLNWGHSYVWTYDSFHYYPEEDKLSVNVSVKPDINIHFIILSPRGRQRSNSHRYTVQRRRTGRRNSFYKPFRPRIEYYQCNLRQRQTSD